MIKEPFELVFLAKFQVAQKISLSHIVQMEGGNVTFICDDMGWFEKSCSFQMNWIIWIDLSWSDMTFGFCK